MKAKLEFNYLISDNEFKWTEIRLKKNNFEFGEDQSNGKTFFYNSSVYINLVKSIINFGFYPENTKKENFLISKKCLEFLFSENSKVFLSKM